MVTRLQTDVCSGMDDQFSRSDPSARQTYKARAFGKVTAEEKKTRFTSSGSSPPLRVSTLARAAFSQYPLGGTIEGTRIRKVEKVSVTAFK